MTGVRANKVVTIKEGRGLIEQKDFAGIKKSIARNGRFTLTARSTTF